MRGKLAFFYIAVLLAALLMQFAVPSHPEWKIDGKTRGITARVVAEEFVPAENNTLNASNASQGGIILENSSDNTLDTSLQENFTENVSQPEEVEEEVNDSGISEPSISGDFGILLDSTPPNVTLISPLNGTTYTESDNVSFIFNVTDDFSNISSCTLEISNSSNISALFDNKTISQIAVNNNNTIGSTLTNSLILSRSWSVRCSDNSSNNYTAPAVQLYIDGRNLTRCNRIVSPNVTYLLSQNITAGDQLETCINLTVKDTAVDCQNYSLLATAMGGIRGINLSNVTIKNCIVLHNGSQDAGISFNYSSDIRILNNFITNNPPKNSFQDGIYISYSTRVNVINNTVKGPGFLWGGIILENTSHSTFLNNTVTNATYSLRFYGGWANNSNVNNTIQNNILDNATSRAMELNGISHSLFIQNVIIGAGTAYYIDAQYETSGVNNTIINTTQTGSSALDISVTNSIVRLVNVYLGKYFFTNITLIVENATNVRLEMLNLTQNNLTNANFSDHLIARSNYLFINSSNASGLNISANITFFNLNLGSPTILRDGSPCPAPLCTLKAYNTSNGTIMFNVSGFSEYTILANGTSPTITLVSPVNGSTYTDSDNVSFIFNISGSTDITNCTLIINSGTNVTNMSMINISNNSTLAAPLTNNVDVPYNWTVNCTTSEGATGTAAMRQIYVDGRNLTICNALVTGNATYYLTQHLNLSSSLVSVCFNITKSDILFDCQNYSINGSAYTPTRSIIAAIGGAPATFGNITVQNCKIFSDPGGYNGIYYHLTRESAIRNNELWWFWHAINLSSSENINISSNVIRNASNSINFDNSSNSIIENNTISNSSSCAISFMYKASFHNQIVRNNISNGTSGICSTMSSGEISLNTSIINFTAQGLGSYELDLSSMDVKIINSSIVNYRLTSTSLQLENYSYAKVQVPNITRTGANFMTDFVLRLNYTFINTTSTAGANRTANLTFFGLSLINPGILRNGMLCPAATCQAITSNLSNGTFILNVTGFSSYEILENITTPSVTLVSPANGTTYTQSENVTFVFNVTHAYLMKNCSIIIDQGINTTNASAIILSGNNTINVTLENNISYGYVWNVNCVDSFGNKANGTTAQTVLVDVKNLTRCNPLVSGNVSYYLLQNVTNLNHSRCFDILTSDIIFDCQNYLINGTDPSFIGGGITSGMWGQKVHNLTIKNCVINGTWSSAIYLNNTDNSSIMNTLIQTAYWGVNLSTSESINFSNNIVKGSQISIGLSKTNFSIIVNNTFGAVASGVGRNVIITRGNYNRFNNNKIIGGSICGVPVTNSSHNQFINNTISNTSSTFCYSDNTPNNTIINNTFINNSGSDISLSNASMEIKDTIFENYSITNVTLIVENSSNAKIELPNVTSSGANFSADVIIMDNFVFINSSNAPGLNKSANITFFRLLFDDAVIQRDGADCPASICTKKEYNASNGTLIFNVSGFSNYSAAEGPAPFSGSSSGGGGGGSSFTTYNVGEIKDDEDGVNKELKKDDVVKFESSGGKHTLAAKSLASDSGTFELASTPIIFTLIISQTKKFNLSNDFIYDAQITLNEIYDTPGGRRANLTLKSIAEIIPPASQTQQQAAQQQGQAQEQPAVANEQEKQPEKGAKEYFTFRITREDVFKFLASFFFALVVLILARDYLKIRKRSVHEKYVPVHRGQEKHTG